MRTESEMRQAVVFSALLEYHQQKFMRLGNSLRPLRDDKRRDAYFRRVLGPKWKGPYPNVWCAAFALWCLQEAQLAPGVVLIVNNVNGKGSGFCEPCNLPKVYWNDAQPGDICWFIKQQHHAVLERVDEGPEGPTLWTVDGNQPAIDRHGPQGSLPARHISVGCEFYSIAPFIAAALKAERP